MSDLLNNLVQNPAPVLWSFSLILAVLYFRELILDWKFRKDYSRILEEARSKGIEAVQEGVRRAQAIISQAESESLRIIGESKMLNQSWKENMETKMQENQGIISSQTNQLFEKFEANLSTYLTQTQQQSIKAIELELQAARSLIENYKASQLKIVDENIVAILEKTLSIILAKKLTLADQMDLVYQALEKAKAEKFFV